MTTQAYLKHLDIEKRKLAIKEMCEDDPHKRAEIRKKKESKEKLFDFLSKRCNHNMEQATIN